MGLSGTLVTLESGMLPLEDIAVGLSRAPRFVGQTVLPWFVIDHILAGMVYAERAGWSKAIQLHFGLHDAHEAMTADVPTTFKTGDLRAIQRKLDARLYVALGLYSPTWAEKDVVKELDEDMLLAEAYTLCPPATYERIVVERGHRKADHDHIVAVGEVLSWSQMGQMAAEEWLARIRQLIEEVQQ